MAPKLHRLETPISDEALADLKAGDEIHISGTIYTGRDAAHGLLMKLIEADEPLPIEIAGQVIYYCGPAPAPPGSALGSAGPTTSYRMDPFAPELYQLGLAATIGKGDRGEDVREACRRFGKVYLVAVGGAGALLSRTVTAAKVVAYPELGPEAIRRLEVQDFPAIVAYDARGGSVFPADQPLQE